MEECASEERINLILMNDTAYVWTSKDWSRLRKLRIVGNFVGNLAALPRQGQIAGLPLALLEQETTLLLEKGFAVLKSIKNASVSPGESVRERSTAFREKLFSEQSELMVDKRKREIESKIDVILEGKKAKRKPEEALDKDTVLQEEFEKIQPPKKSHLAVEICTDDPWLEEKDYEECSWKGPKDHLRYLVFKDLWERGYHITPGGKFGGDYLVYPGDPLKFHAFFVIVCVESDQRLTMSEIITYGRLGQSVKKTVALAYLNDEDKVDYQSIQWAGF